MRRIFDEAAAGKSGDGVARDFNRDGIPDTEGRSCQASTIRRICIAPDSQLWTRSPTASPNTTPGEPHLTLTFSLGVSRRIGVFKQDFSASNFNDLCARRRTQR